MAEFKPVGKLSDLAPGCSKVVDVNGKALALFNVAGVVHAMDNTCRHRGGPLGGGMLEGDVVTCPWHMWEYNVRAGELVTNPTVKLATYDVQVKGDEIKVAI